MAAASTASLELRGSDEVRPAGARGQDDLVGLVEAGSVRSGAEADVVLGRDGTEVPLGHEVGLGGVDAGGGVGEVGLLGGLEDAAVGGGRGGVALVRDAA